MGGPNHWTLIFFVVALVAAIFAFCGADPSRVGPAKITFVVSVAFACLSMLLPGRR